MQARFRQPALFATVKGIIKSLHYIYIGEIVNNRRQAARKRKFYMGVILTVIIIALSGYVGYKAAYLVAGWSNMTESSDDVDDIIEDTQFNILLVGIDKVSESTDVLMLLNVDTEKLSVNISSVYRDTRVNYNGRYCKINSVYKRASRDIGETIKAVKEITGAPVNYYVMVDLEGFEYIVDELGGVDFYVPQDMKYSDPVQNLYIDLKEGQQHLDGNKAMQLVRFRKYLQGDVERANVQQDFITALIEQKLNARTIAKAPELFYELSDYIKTNVTAGVITSNVKLLKKMQDCTITHYEMPGEGNYVGAASYFLQYEDEVYDMYAEYFNGEGAPKVRKYTDYNKAGWPEGWTHSIS